MQYEEINAYYLLSNIAIPVAPLLRIPAHTLTCYKQDRMFIDANEIIEGIIVYTII